MAKSRIDNAIADLSKIIKAKKTEGYDDFYFVASFSRGKQKGNGIERGDPSQISKLIRSYVKTECPDLITIEFREGEDHKVIARKVIELATESEMTASRSGSVAVDGLNGFDGLGVIQVNELVSRKVQEIDKEREAAQNVKELEELRVAHHAVCCEKEELEKKIKTKETFEHILTIVGAALPGVAGFFAGTPLGPMVTALAGTGEQQGLIESPDAEPTDNRGITIKMLIEYLHTLTDQELAAMQLICMNLERDRNEIQVLLNHYLKKQQPQPTQNQTSKPFKPNGHIQQQQADALPA